VHLFCGPRHWFKESWSSLSSTILDMPMISRNKENIARTNTLPTINIVRSPTFLSIIFTSCRCPPHVILAGTDCWHSNGTNQNQDPGLVYSELHVQGYAQNIRLTISISPWSCLFNVFVVTSFLSLKTLLYYSTLYPSVVLIQSHFSIQHTSLPFFYTRASHT
jgi:hypothetical protein